MAKAIDHDVSSSVSTVGIETGKGAAKGIGAVAVGGVLAVAGTLALAAGAIALVFNAPLVALGIVATGAVVAATSPVWLGAAGIGAGLGALGGIKKVQNEKARFQAQARSNDIVPTIQAAQQQAYVAGVQAGQADIVQKLQEAQAAQEQQTNFAEKFTKKGVVTPEAIIAQREAATNHLG